MANAAIGLRPDDQVAPGRRGRDLMERDEIGKARAARSNYNRERWHHDRNCTDAHRDGDRIDEGQPRD